MSATGILRTYTDTTIVIYFMSDWLKMIGINATTIAAQVVEFQSFRDSAIFGIVSEAVSNLGTTPTLDDTVPIVPNISYPKPTSVCSNNSRFYCCRKTIP